MTIDSMQRFEVDEGEIRLAVQTLFEPEDWIELRSLRLDREGGGARAKFITAESAINDDVLGWLTNRNSPGFALYFGANVRHGNYGQGKGGMGTDADVKMARCLFVDFDDAAPKEALHRIESAGLPSPTLLIASGRDTGAHAYWRFNDPITDMDFWKRLQVGLIRAVQSDPSIKNPCRIMRLPGSQHHKHGRMCFVVKRATSPVYDSWVDLGIEPAEEFQTFPDGDETSNTRRNVEMLNPTTRNFLDYPCESGERNNKLFASACEFKANGFTYEEATKELADDRAIRRDGLSAHEAYKAVSSAYSRQVGASIQQQFIDDPYELLSSVNRVLPFNSAGKDTPMVDPSEVGSDEVGPARDFDVHRMVEPAEGEPSDLEPQPRAPIQDDRPSFGNVDLRVAQSNGKKSVVVIQKPIDAIHEQVKGIGWPCSAESLGLFYTSYDSKGNEKAHSVNKVSELFAMFHERAQVSWTRGLIESEAGKQLTAVTKEEFTDYLRVNPVRQYEAVAEYPHHPIYPDYYYLKRNLPQSTGDALRNFVDAFNPDTEEDRALMLAALMTPGWGGPPGTRPLFVFSSDYGQGSGKTETAKAIANVWGGAPMLPVNQPWEQTMKGLFSSGDWNTRVGIFDNVKGRFGGSDIEGAITAHKISGWKSYVGQVSRRNDITYFLTYNLPEMSRDLSERSVIIRLGKPKPGRFVSWAAEYVAEHRWAIISDILHLLSGPPAEAMPIGGDRWGAWRDGVLSRVYGASPVRLAEVVVERRQTADGDDEEALEIIYALRGYLREKRPEGIQGDVGAITAKEIELTMHAQSLFEVDSTKSASVNRQKCMRLVRGKLLGRSVLAPVSSPGSSKQMRVRVNDLGRPLSGQRLPDGAPAPMRRDSLLFSLTMS